MRLFSVVFAMTVITILFGSILNKIEIINQLENQLELQKSQTDSLIHKIDIFYLPLYMLKVVDMIQPTMHQKMQLVVYK